MGDMAPRPRGGWQVGTHLTRLHKSLVETADEAPDRYTVDRSAAPTFVVRHYPSAEAARPCCRPVQVIRRDGEADVDALTRAMRLVNRQHEGPVT